MSTVALPVFYCPLCRHYTVMRFPDLPLPPAIHEAFVEAHSKRGPICRCPAANPISSRMPCLSIITRRPVCCAGGPEWLPGKCITSLAYHIGGPPATRTQSARECRRNHGLAGIWLAEGEFPIESDSHFFHNVLQFSAASKDVEAEIVKWMGVGREAVKPLAQFPVNSRTDQPDPELSPLLAAMLEDTLRAAGQELPLWVAPASPYVGAHKPVIGGPAGVGEGNGGVSEAANGEGEAAPLLQSNGQAGPR